MQSITSTQTFQQSILSRFITHGKAGCSQTGRINQMPNDYLLTLTGRILFIGTVSCHLYVVATGGGADFKNPDFKNILSSLPAKWGISVHCVFLGSLCFS